MPASRDLADPSSPVAPSREDPVVAEASEVLGGRVGEHAVLAGRGAAGVFVALVTATVGLVAAGVVERAHCIGAGWNAPDHFWHACYSDVPVVYSTTSLATGGGLLGADSRLDLPLPTALVAWVAARLVPGGHVGLEAARWYFGLWSAVVVALLVLLVGLLVRGMPRHPWRVAHLASPALPFVALVSFEVVPVTLVGAGVVAWGRRRPVLAGVLLGVACVARPWSVLAVAAIGLVALRAGALGPWLRSAGAAVVTVVAVIGLTAALRADHSLGVYAGWWRSGASYGSPWFLATLAEVRWSPGLLSVVAGAGWLLALVVGAVFALSLDRRPRVGEVILVVLVVAMLTGKSLPVQAGLWMIVLMALVGVRWRTHLAWAGVEVAYFVAVWLHIAAASAPDRGLPAGWYSVFVLARLVAWAWVAAEVWQRAAERPAARAVRRPGPEPTDSAAESDAGGGRSRPEPGATEDESGRYRGRHEVQAAAGETRASRRAAAGVAARGHGESRRAGGRYENRGAASASGVGVVEDDELAGPLAGRTDDTVVTFV